MRKIIISALGIVLLLGLSVGSAQAGTFNRGASRDVYFKYLNYTKSEFKYHIGVQAVIKRNGNYDEVKQIWVQAYDYREPGRQIRFWGETGVLKKDYWFQSYWYIWGPWPVSDINNGSGWKGFWSSGTNWQLFASADRFGVPSLGTFQTNDYYKWILQRFRFTEGSQTSNVGAADVHVTW